MKFITVPRGRSAAAKQRLAQWQQARKAARALRCAIAPRCGRLRAGKPMSELLTQLQDQLHIVSKMFFDFVGILQRDAPPISVAGAARHGPLAHTVGDGSCHRVEAAQAGCPRTVLTDSGRQTRSSCLPERGLRRGTRSHRPLPNPPAGEAVLPSAQQHQQQQQQHAPGQPPPQFDVERTTQLMATQLIEQFKLTDALIRALPDERISAPDHSDRIRDLQREHDDVSRELEAAAREAEEQLAELQRMFAVLARQRLADAQQGLPLAPLPPMG